MRLALARRAALLGAAGFFLWMFLAAAPLETLADTGGLAGRHEADVVAEGYRVAADWRHGMAGNSPLYMPGFFALAVAAWFWAESSRTPAMRLIVEGGIILAGGHVVGRLCAGLAAESMVAACERIAGLTVVDPWPAPPWRAAAQGLYTAATWIVFVVACRRALARPFARSPRLRSTDGHRARIGAAVDRRRFRGALDRSCGRGRRRSRSVRPPPSLSWHRASF